MSSGFTDLLDKNYAANFEDFHLDTTKTFPGVDFDSIKLPTIVESSLLQTSFEDMDIEDDALTPLLTKDGSKFGNVALSGLSK